jgi:hypothetical protein
MRSERENNDWLHKITWTYDHLDTPEALEPDVSWELARHVWESENSIIIQFRGDMLRHVANEESLRKYLEFDLIDSSLWAAFATLIYSLLERNDITNVDFVIRRITEFVQMCSHFYPLRFGPEHPLRKAGTAPVTKAEREEATDTAGVES